MHVAMRASAARTTPYRFARGPLAVAALLASLSSTARAETPQQIAETHFRAGLKLYNQDNFEAARLEFLQAQAVYPRSSLLRNLALCELKTNRPLEALHHLRTYLADPASDSRDYAKKNLDDAYARTGHITVRAIEGAAVSVDGQAQGNAPFKDPIDLLPGKHLLEARLGERKLSRDVDAPAGSVIETDLRFEEKPAPIGVSAPANTEATAARSPVEPPHEEPRSSARWLWPAGLGLGVVAGVGLGLGFAAAHRSSVDEADRINASAPGGNVCASAASDGCRARQDKLSTASNQATISNVSYIVGGAFLVAAITSAVVVYWPRASTTNNVALAPLLGPGVGGFQLSRNF